MIFFFFSEEGQFTATWSVPEKFTEIIVSTNMLGHHFPGALLEAIDYLRDNSFNLKSAKSDLGALNKWAESDSGTGTSEADVTVLM